MARLPRMLCVCLLGAMAASVVAEEAPVKAGVGERIVFLGSSSIDGHTVPLLVAQAFRDAGRGEPVVVNAGVGGNTTAEMVKRIDRDVLAHKPSRVVVYTGINDILRGVSPAEFENELKAIGAALDDAKIPVILLTTGALGPKHGDRTKALEEVNAILRRTANDRGWAVADYHALIRAALGRGEALFSPDDLHVNFAGYRIMAGAVLSAMGAGDVPVPDVLKLEPMPGIVRDWKMVAVTNAVPPLDNAAVAALVPDAAWRPYRLPETEPVADWWKDQERQRGFAVSLELLLGKAKSYRGVAEFDAGEARTVYLNTGAELRSAWLNGERVYQAGAEYRGWHAGRERIAVKLRKGPNHLVIECGGSFFVSFTDSDAW